MRLERIGATLVAVCAAGTLASSCQAPGGAHFTALTLEAAAPSLYAPQVLDWATQRLSSPGLAARRKAHFRALAFPTAGAGWSVGATPGLPLTNFGLSATDWVPNGPAAAFTTDPASPLYNKMFFLSKEGKLIKVDRATPTSYTVWSAPVGKVFLRTYVTLSPLGSRAYVLSNDGTLYVINTAGMTTAAVLAVGGGGYGIAPWLDPLRSAHDDRRESLWIAANNGIVNQYTISGAPDGTIADVSAATSYNVSTAVTPLYGGTRKIAAPPLVLGGVIYQGDQGGNLQVYDTNDPFNNYTYALGAPVNASPALELQDGSYSLTDPQGAPITVATGLPIYAFVNAGGSCAWINLYDTSVTRSQSLRIDDNDSTRKFGYLLDYGYNTGGNTEYLAAQDGGNLNTESPDRALPGYTPNVWSNDYLVPAETNTYENPTNVAAGGPVVGFMRWSSSASYPVGAVVNSASLTLTPAFDQPCRVPEIRSTSPLYQDGSSPWASNALTTTNRPAIGGGNVGIYNSGGINASGNVDYRNNKGYVWDVSGAFTSPPGDGRYALALKYNAGGNVLWPEGPVGGGTGKKAKKATQTEAVKFRNNALNANPAAGTSNDTRPLLTLVVSNTTLPTASLETPPLIDSTNKVIYAYYTNALYAMSYASPAAFSDADINTQTGQQTKHTLFNLAYLGDSANNAAGVGGKKPGGAYNNRSQLVGNFSASVPNLDLSALYVLSRTPNPDGTTPTTWNYAASKITLPLSATADSLVAGSPTVTSIPGQAALTGLTTEKDASAYMVVDPFPGVGSVYFGLADGRLYQYER